MSRLFQENLPAHVAFTGTWKKVRLTSPARNVCVPSNSLAGSLCAYEEEQEEQENYDGGCLCLTSVSQDIKLPSILPSPLKQAPYSLTKPA